MPTKQKPKQSPPASNKLYLCEWCPSTVTPYTVNDNHFMYRFCSLAHLAAWAVEMLARANTVT